MLDYGIRNLHNHCSTVKQLNVFPVPDGDTGTNMVVTIRKGLHAVEPSLCDLPSIAKKFAHSIVFEARGNSGVIVSQFFKGVSEAFFNTDIADAALLVEALERGVVSAHAAVANPVEGTMLTVLREATEAVKHRYRGDFSIGEIISLFVENAKRSLENTPELLPVLKKAGVVDSGGAGIVYLFEGMKKYLDGEEVEASEADSEDTSPSVDYSAFHRDSRFAFGYCTELLLQLLNGKEPFDYDTFRQELNALGDSVVTSFDDDKVRIHIHTPLPEEIFSYCHRFGEFLSLKVENMTVQHTETTKHILCSKGDSDSLFSVVAVAYDPTVQQLFLDMGADVVIYCEEGASTKDFIDAFEHVHTHKILVFPNRSDSILSAIQAKNLYKKASVTVINSRGVAECYASLPTIHFEETDVDAVVDDTTETINNLYVVSVVRRKATDFRRDEFYALSGKEILAVGSSPEEAVLLTVGKVFKKAPKDVITLFHGKGLTDEGLCSIVDSIGALGLSAEIFTVPTESESSLLTLSFE